ncbi:hypothetical protein BSLG_009691 [Batrachochytrium salamandrivorans]|nr:hypothetical protein BSLG_009691 [Batrachochytrium salamandrivorans]
MNLPLLFDTVVLHAHEAKKLYLLGDLHSACRRTGEALRGATALLEILSNPSGVPPVDVYEEEDMQEKFTPNSMLSHPAIMQALDDIFFDFLASICSDLDALIDMVSNHSKSADWQKLRIARFKVRIKSFTQAFTDQVERLKPQFPQLVNVHRHILQSCAQTVQNGKVQWEFQISYPILSGQSLAPLLGLVNALPTSPAYYDPQSLDTAVVFHSPWLPYWLQWQGSTLHGVPDINSQSCEITVVASFKSISGSEILPLV